MGLDTVELVMEIEEAFDISIPEERASQMLTVGDVYDFLLEKTEDSSLKPNTCLSAATFYALRRQLRMLDTTDPEIRPNSKLDAVVPLTKRRFYWRELSSRMDLRFPQLTRPSWLVLLNCICVAIVVYATFLAFAMQDALLGFVVAGLLGILSAVFLFYLTLPFAVFASPTCSNIRELITHVVANNSTKLLARYGTRNATDTWNTLQLIVAEQLGVDRNAVVPHARFVQDLGAD